MAILKKLLVVLFSLKAVVVSLCWMGLLILVGTLDQAVNGLHDSLSTYFYSWVVWKVFPGGMTSMVYLCAVLLVSFVIHFRLGARMIGLLVVHAGLLMMMLGGAITFITGSDSHVDLREGEVTRLSSAFHEWELAFTPRDGATPTYHAVDSDGFRPGDTVVFPEVGVRVTVKEYCEDASVIHKGQDEPETSDRLTGLFQRLQAEESLGELLDPQGTRRGRGETVVEILALPEDELSEAARGTRAALLRQVPVLAERDPSVERLVETLGQTERVRFIEDNPDDPELLVRELKDTGITIALLRGGEPNAFFDGMIEEIQREGRMGFARLHRDWGEGVEAIAGFREKDTVRAVERSFAKARRQALDEAMRAMDEEPLGAVGRAWLSVKRIVGIHDPRYDAIQKVEKTFEQRVDNIARHKEPERRIPGMVAEVQFLRRGAGSNLVAGADGEPEAVGKPVTVVLDGANDMVRLDRLDPKITRGDGQDFWVRLQRKRHALPIQIQLNDFIRTTHANDRGNKEFISRVSVRDLETGAVHHESIEMNKPYRHRGYTVYQTSFRPDMPDFSTLTVKFNRGRLIPYVSTIIVFLGLLVHFLLILADYANRKARA